MKVRSAVVLVTIWALTVVGVAIVTWQVIHFAGHDVLDDSAGPALGQGNLPTPSPSMDSVWRPPHSPTARPGAGPPRTAPPTPNAPSSDGSDPASNPTGTPSLGVLHGPSTAPSNSSPGDSTHHGPPTSTASHPAPPAAPEAAAHVDSWRGEAGVLTISCEPGRIRMLGATPGDGYRVEVEQEEDEVQAHFKREDPEDEVQVVAHCADGVPQFEVEEDDRSHEDRPSGPLTS